MQTEPRQPEPLQSEPLQSEPEAQAEDTARQPSEPEAQAEDMPRQRRQPQLALRALWQACGAPNLSNAATCRRGGLIVAGLLSLAANPAFGQADGHIIGKLENASEVVEVFVILAINHVDNAAILKSVHRSAARRYQVQARMRTFAD